MGYFIRVLGAKDTKINIEEINLELSQENLKAYGEVVTGHGANWSQILLKHPKGEEFALLECNRVGDSDKLAKSELAEFSEEVSHYKPKSAANWLKKHFKKIKVIYSFQILNAAEKADGWPAIHTVQSLIWRTIDGILQADNEGFSNEDGYHILWQFSPKVSGHWKMAVLIKDEWHPFEMDLGSEPQREAFWQGLIPPGAKAI